MFMLMRFFRQPFSDYFKLLGVLLDRHMTNTLPKSTASLISIHRPFDTRLPCLLRSYSKNSDPRSDQLAIQQRECHSPRSIEIQYFEASARIERTHTSYNSISPKRKRQSHAVETPLAAYRKENYR